MRAMILAAGRGERMRPLTNHTPKPLLKVREKPLILYHLERLHAAGIKDVVINHGPLGQQIETLLGDGSQYGMRLQYSREGDEPLETGGGMQNALPLLGETVFIGINADIWTDYDYSRLSADFTALAHLILVRNPEHNPAGDFALAGDRVRNEGPEKYTFSGIGVYRPALFTGAGAGRYSVTPLLRAAADKNQVTGEIYSGVWRDIGTPERLAEIQDLPFE